MATHVDAIDRRILLPRARRARRVSASIALLAIAGCASSYPATDLPPAARGAPRFTITADEPWTATHLRVAADQWIEIWADGDACMTEYGPLGWNGSERYGPRGTFAWNRRYSSGQFALAAGDDGPAPAFALIGRIGADGAPFFVGDHCVVKADRAGELSLGVNDCDFDDNSGWFRAAVRIGARQPASITPVDRRPVITATAEPRPVKDSRVVMIFVDGLRADVLRELAFNGYLPNFKRIFFDAGTEMERTTTIAPANTIPATTACLTGSWPDRTGLVEQITFHRDSGSLDTLLDTFGPTKSARKIRAEWWRVAFPSGGERPLLINEWCARAGRQFSSTVLPVLPDYPPDLYVQRLANVVPFFGVQELKRTYADRVQTSFALEQVIRSKNHVMALWYSGVDAASHETARGEFGPARQALAFIDRDLASLEAKLKKEGIDDRTYWVLWADHGFIGGDTHVSRNYDLANDFFFEGLADADGDRRPDADGGLGMNARFMIDEIPVTREHSDLEGKHFAACATMAYAAAWFALPKRSFLSGDWKEPNTASELMHYEVHPDFDPVDVPRRLLDVRRPEEARAAGIPENPVALVCIPVPPEGVLVLGQEGRAALIERRHRAGTPPRTFDYRFRPLRDWRVGDDGVTGETSTAPGDDPFGFVATPAIAARLQRDGGWLEAWHDDREWLEATADAEYPDAVVTLAHALLNDPDDPRFDANERFDAWVIASRGWSFASGHVHPMTNHGALQKEGVRVPFIVAGPNIAHGARVSRPTRLIDVLPTVLDLAGIAHLPAEHDGRAVTEIWAEPSGDRAATPMAMKFDHGLAVPPDDTHVPQEALIHDSSEWYDLHNLAANLSSVLYQEIVNTVDGPVDAVVPGRSAHPLGSTLDFMSDSWDELPDSKFATRPAELVEALRLRHITIGEFVNPIQSLQNVDRAVGVIHWCQAVVQDPFRPLGTTQVIVFYPFNKAIDGACWVILAARDVLERTMIRVVDGSIEGVEGGMRFTAAAFGGNRPDPPPRVRTAATTHAARR